MFKMMLLGTTFSVKLKAEAFLSLCGRCLAGFNRRERIAMKIISSGYLTLCGCMCVVFLLPISHLLGQALKDVPVVGSL